MPKRNREKHDSAGNVTLLKQNKKENNAPSPFPGSSPQETQRWSREILTNKTLRHRTNYLTVFKDQSLDKRKWTAITVQNFLLYNEKSRNWINDSKSQLRNRKRSSTV